MTHEEQQHKQRDEELKQAIVDLGDKLNKRLLSLESKVDPMYEIFTSVNGFNKIAIWILKLLAAIGVALGGLYALIEFFRRLAK